MEGDEVLVHNIKKVKRLPGTKDTKKYLGPYTIEKVKPSHLVARKDPDSKTTKSPIHLSRKYHSRINEKRQVRTKTGKSKKPKDPANSLLPRAYSDDYLKFGFTCIAIEGIEKPQCVICMKVLSAESMKPLELKRHFEKEHPTYKDRDVSFFQRQSQSVKKSRLDTTGQTAITIRVAVEASYVVSLRISKSKKPHTIGEELVFLCTKDIVRIMNGADARRIQEMSEDIKNQVVEQIKQSPIFVLQLDESTDVSSCAQLMIYVRYIHDSNFKEEFLFCQSLDSQTRGIDVFNKVDTFFVKEGLDWK
ncbi:zinc finger BED domain-containing protein 5-like [Oopsacas minuta]|uniref:Zinc finger BED domain-containing protein 5-like n=1 Tax=Oopsacas minuta TaxID=111878 RepID=A0AAV7KEW2_9METZ|nr:zinc finger BED domain-containing protein 5-like [Oopsacas minuta]